MCENNLPAEWISSVRETILYTERDNIIVGQLHIWCSVTIRRLHSGYEMRARIENGSVCPFGVVESAFSACAVYIHTTAKMVKI